MSKDYVEGKIREALRAHGKENIIQVRQKIRRLAYEDARLMSALARPHLDGIIAYQVDRVASGRAELEKRHPDMPEAQSDAQENFGMDLLRAVAGQEVTVFGHEQSSAPIRRKTASQQHIEAIHKMASKRQNKN